MPESTAQTPHMSTVGRPENVDFLARFAELCSGLQKRTIAHMNIISARDDDRACRDQSRESASALPRAKSRRGCDSPPRDRDGGQIMTRSRTPTWQLRVSAVSLRIKTNSGAYPAPSAASSRLRTATRHSRQLVVYRVTRRAATAAASSRLRRAPPSLPFQCGG